MAIDAINSEEQMRISNLIENLIGLADLPLRITDNSRKKYVRVVGVLWFVLWFFPVMLIAVLVGGLLAIPAMVQDA